MDEFIYKEEGYKIIGCFYAVYNNLGPGFLESVYQEALAIEFDKNKIPYIREQKLEIYYNEEKLKKYFKADFICYNTIIVETKAQKFTAKTDIDQIINYLSATKIEVAYLVNFGAPQLFYKRLIYTDKRNR
jgi:GxxExxY protein